MMESLDFRYVFIGIETPDKDLLALTQKKQNIRYPIVDSVHRLYQHGMVVLGGFIVGFDGETRAAAKSLVACVDAAGIPVAMVGLLMALPNTQLSRRLAREGRLPEDYSLIQEPGDVDQSTMGLNFATLRPRVEILEDFESIVRLLYSPRSYFDRVGRMAALLRRNFEAAIHVTALFLHLRKHSLLVLDSLQREITRLRLESDASTNSGDRWEYPVHQSNWNPSRTKTREEHDPSLHSNKQFDQIKQ
jgi:hypothetical protein